MCYLTKKRQLDISWLSIAVGWGMLVCGVLRLASDWRVLSLDVCVCVFLLVKD